MKKKANPLPSPALHVLLFILFLALLSWPLVTIAEKAGPPHTISVYLFILWLLMVVWLFAVGRSCQKNLKTEPAKKEVPAEQ